MFRRDFDFQQEEASTASEAKTSAAQEQPSAKEAAKLNTPTSIPELPPNLELEYTEKAKSPTPETRKAVDSYSQAEDTTQSESSAGDANVSTDDAVRTAPVLSSTLIVRCCKSIS